MRRCRWLADLAAGPFRWAGEHIACELPGGSVLFTTRRGGVSEPPYDTLNLGLLTADDPRRWTPTETAWPR